MTARWFEKNFDDVHSQKRNLRGKEDMHVLSSISLFGKEEVLEVWTEPKGLFLFHILWLTLWFLLPLWFLSLGVVFGFLGIGMMCALSLYALVRLWSLLRVHTTSALVVTTNRLLSIRGSAFRRKTTDSIDLHMIDHIEVVYPSFLSRCFRSGLLRVHLRGSSTPFVSPKVARVGKVQTIVEAIRAASSSHHSSITH